MSEDTNLDLTLDETSETENDSEPEGATQLDEATVLDLIGSKYRGHLKNKPKKSAMEQLLEVKDPEILDSYLVEKDYTFEGDYVSEIYTWYGNESGWVFRGSTNMAGSLQHYLELLPNSASTDDKPNTESEVSNEKPIFVQFTPDINLPEYPTYATQVIDGVKYKVYLETNWESVVTEEGVSLKDLINSLPVYDPPTYYHYKGYLKNKPNKSAMEQLLEIEDPWLLDIYLVERDYTYHGDYVTEIYTWYGNESGWVYTGSCNPAGTIQNSLPGILDIIPETLGDPNDFMLVTEDGKGLCWGNPLREHMNDPESHPDIRKLIDDIVVPKIKVFSDTLDASNWIYNPISDRYEYYYTSEITPILDDADVSEAIKRAGINPTYPILTNSSGYKTPHAVIRATTPPGINIPISVHLFGGFEEIEPPNE